ncbi:MAG TPA: hypothetical protein VHH90_07855 [Polyangia bacterium]|nr:hypothetical protein [Polyangia bacterium]
MALGAVLVSLPARAYDPATTHAGLTERAALASGLHRVLARRLARPLGLFEPIALDRGHLDPVDARVLGGRLDALDPAGGYRPGPDGGASALGWVIAGTVIAGTPAERGQNFFYDPSRGNGLSNAEGLFETGYSLRMLFTSGGGLRSAATGTTFNLTGRPSTEWLLAPDNDVGLRVFYDQLEASGVAPDPRARATALARALLALGGTLAVLEDAGDPAHVRNDFSGAYMRAGGGSPFDRGSSYERYVAETFGQSGVPAPAAPVDRPNVLAYITAADAQGLADRTQRRFFSDGTLPTDVVVDRETTPAEVLRDARDGLPYGLPTVPRLDLAGMGDIHYAYAPAGSDVGPAGPASKLPGQRRRLLAYLRVPGRVRFFLDPSVYQDTARTLLPEIGAYGAGLIDHLFRAEIQLDIGAADGAVNVRVSGARGAVTGGQVRLYADDGAGNRRPFATVPANTGGSRLTVPAGARRIAAVLRGSDAAGDLVAVSEAPVP